MKKLSTKTMSSPGRAEKYPTQPPLMMRFLRSNVGSRSRGRSRSSPMFVRKKNNTTATETQEPTSPKVTCMGQVRARRPKNRPKKSILKRFRCDWVSKNALFCRLFNGKFKSFSLRLAWKKIVSFFHCKFNRKVKKDSNFECKSEGSNQVRVKEKEEDDNDNEEVVEAKVSSSFNPVSPPKNVLLLTRCRSAPYRSSSLAVRFWGSPISNEETEQKQSETEQENRVETEEEADDDSEIPASIKVSTVFSRSESEGKIGAFQEFEDPIASIRKKIEELRRTKKIGGSRCTGVEPLTLTRCKSGPARTGEKLDGFVKEEKVVPHGSHDLIK